MFMHFFRNNFCALSIFLGLRVVSHFAPSFFAHEYHTRVQKSSVRNATPLEDPKKLRVWVLIGVTKEVWNYKLLYKTKKENLVF
jgi:hypothetical protein